MAKKKPVTTASTKKTVKKSISKKPQTAVTTLASSEAEKNSITTSRRARVYAPIKRFVVSPAKRLAGRLYIRQLDFLNRRPHRTLKLTRRRDYRRSLKLPGYFAFTLYVWKVLWAHKWTFFWVWLVFVVLLVGFGLLGSQTVYDELGHLVTSSAQKGMFDGFFGNMNKAGVTLLTATTKGLSGTLTSGQQITLGAVGLYVWLTVVWLLRNFLGEKKVKFRDALYSAGAPIISTLLTVLILLIQLVPMGVAIIVTSSIWQSGVIQGGVESMALSVALIMIVLLSLYWVTSTFFAMVIVTLPGMYPLRAMVIAGDLVIGRRLRLFYRVLWLLVTLLSWWIVIMIPTIVFDSWIKSVFKQIAGWPIVPVVFMLLATFLIIWAASYIYLLYRKVVDDDASPA